jgi:hypothetical protein
VKERRTGSIGAGLLGIALATLAGGPLPGAEEPAPLSPAEEIEALKRRIEALERDAAAGKEGGREEAAPDAGGAEIQPLWKREAIETPPALRTVYDKPFLVSLWRRAYLGGYTELEYHSFEDGVLGIPEGFRMHRTNLFLYADVSDRIRFGSEIEFENEEPGEDLEVKVEMAFVDWVIAEEFVVRGGALLVPLGRINVNHDGPVREITDRPMVSTFVIPTTLTDAGIGPRGSFFLGDAFHLNYEAYAVNGFQILDQDGELVVPPTEIEQILREGRPSLGGDFNGDVATAGRLSLEKTSTWNVGGSWHVGTYDERGDNFLSIIAGDAALVWGPLSLESEIAWAGFQRDDFAKTAGVPGHFWGYYVQASASDMPEALRRAVPSLFGEAGAAFTLVLRYDWVDLDGDRGEAIEPGINFRPFADTVFKFSYRFGLRPVGIRNVPGTEGFDDDGFVFSLSSYF